MKIKNTTQRLGRLNDLAHNDSDDFAAFASRRAQSSSTDAREDFARRIESGALAIIGERGARLTSGIQTTTQPNRLGLRLVGE